MYFTYSLFLFFMLPNILIYISYTKSIHLFLKCLPTKIYPKNHYDDKIDPWINASEPRDNGCKPEADNNETDFEYYIISCGKFVCSGYHALDEIFHVERKKLKIYFFLFM